jgi:hypothetical protein
MSIGPNKSTFNITDNLIKNRRYIVINIILMDYII